MDDATAGGPDLLTVTQAAAVLRCYPKTVYRWIKAGCRVNGCVVLLPRVDVGSRSYFTRAGIAEFQAAVSRAKDIGRATPVLPPERPDERAERMRREHERMTAES